MRLFAPAFTVLAAGLLCGTLPLAAQSCTTSDDTAYDLQIKKNTTLPNFSTELVDHLPLSSCVDSPEKYFGHIMGAPNVLDHVATMNAYLRHLAEQSHRVKVYSIGTSEEGRELVLAAISDEATVANIDHFRDITARLADPRGLAPAAAEDLIREGKPIYWASGSIHSTETGSPEMLMELAYRLAVEETPFIQEIRKDSIVLITPASEVDGRDREVDLYMHSKTHPDEPTPRLVWWGHYVDHDNNRDGLTLSLDLSRNMMNAFLQWHATVLHDLHESEPYLYIQTGTGPYNPWLDPLEIDEWQSMAYREITALTQRGVIGVWTHGFFDGWAPNYLLYVAIGHNAVGRFYETQGNNGADTQVITTPAASTSKEWFRPNPPLPSVLWSARNNVNMQESAILFGMNGVAVNHEEFLRNFYLKSKHSVEKAATEGPAAWLFPGDDARPGLQARLLDQLQRQGVEISRASAAFKADGHEYPAESYVVRMDQPYSREADMLLDQGYYNPSDPEPYDDTGWSMGELADVAAVRIVDTAILKVPMSKLSGPVAPPDGVSGAGGIFLVNANADPNLASFRYRLAAVPMRETETAFEAGGKKFAAGTLVIADASRDQIAAACGAAGVEAVAVAAAPAVTMHAVAAPRIALIHNWQSTQEDGWYRISMDQLHIPYSYIADTAIHHATGLRSRYDVIILPPLGGTLSSMLAGLPMTGKAIPWKNTPDMPSLAPAGLDTTDDMRGGLGLDGLVQLDQFVAAGGLLVTVGPSNVVATDIGMASGVSTRAATNVNARGIVARAEIADAASPVAYGYGHDLDVYYTTGLLLTAGGGGGRGGAGGRGGDTAAPGGRAPTRASGTGSLATPDVIQTRPPAAQLLAESRGPAGEGRPAAAAGRGGRGAAAGPPPRIIVRFVPNASDILYSGLLSGAAVLAGQPLVVDATHGQGHVLLFAANPMWRNETSGEFSLLLNAILNYQHLDAGAPAPGAPGRGRGRGATR